MHSVANPALTSGFDDKIDVFVFMLLAPSHFSAVGANRLRAFSLNDDFLLLQECHFPFVSVQTHIRV